MTKNVNHIQHVKSSVVVEGKPKLPQPSALVEGELAINYADGVETISIKNASSDIVTFSSDNYYTEQKLGSGFTGENSGITVTDALENLEVGSEVEISSGVTPTGETVELWVDESVDPLTVDAYTKAEVNNLLDDKADTADTFTKTELSGSSANVVVKMSESATTASSADTAFSLYAESSITVDSGSSIVLEGEDGSPVKVKKDSFMSAVREALGSLIKNNDKGTSINGVAVTDANNDLGSITTANLASVLGDIQFTFMIENNDEYYDLTVPLRGGVICVGCDGTASSAILLVTYYTGEPDRDLIIITSPVINDRGIVTEQNKSTISEGLVISRKSNCLRFINKKLYQLNVWYRILTFF